MKKDKICFIFISEQWNIILSILIMLLLQRNGNAKMVVTFQSIPLVTEIQELDLFIRIFLDWFCILKNHAYNDEQKAVNGWSSTCLRTGKIIEHTEKSSCATLLRDMSKHIRCYTTISPELLFKPQSNLEKLITELNTQY